MTVGPIESALHPGRGYGTPAYERTLDEIRRMGGNWVSLTPFGRAWDLRTTGVDPTFEAPHAENRAAVRRAIQQAHERGLRVMLVPHLWVESGEWRALVDPGDDEAWRAWARGYEGFVTGWARLAEETRADLFSVGVELRSFATTPRAPLLLDVIRAVRRVYRGPLTYGGNWDDVEDTAILGAIDVIGVNAFYPLADAKGSRFEQLLEGGRRVAERGRALAADWGKPVLFTEIGYTTRPDPGVEPWTWPDGMTGVRVDPAAQAEATLALLAPVLDEPWFAGFFVWRVYADPDDMSQEPEWGFSPRGKPAELVLRDAFSTRWGVERRPGSRAYFSAGRAELPGIY
ncbi:MAG: hypothetical protein FJ104_13535 [Deltaproteobacteria bacterium]|nr:hypothetical protein [Deltaproteobacteria bacterium]